MNIYIEVRVAAGAYLEPTLRQAQRLAVVTGCPVRLRFNGRLVVVDAVPKPKGKRHVWGVRGSRVGSETVVDFCTRGTCNVARRWTPGAKGRRVGSIAWSPNGGATWQWESLPCLGCS